jgi:hypothetical protein
VLGAFPNPIQLVHKAKQQFHPSVFFAFSFIHQSQQQQHHQHARPTYQKLERIQNAAGKQRPGRSRFLGRVVYVLSLSAAAPGRW